jgi:hypothetical protein
MTWPALSILNASTPVAPSAQCYPVIFGTGHRRLRLLGGYGLAVPHSYRQRYTPTLGCGRKSRNVTHHAWAT